MTRTSWWRPWAGTLAASGCLLAGCGSAFYLVPQAGAPSGTLAYQQSVEENNHTLQVTLDQAISDEEQALAEDPRYAAGYLQLAGLFLDAGQDSAAIRALQHVVSLAPRSSSDWVVLGKADAKLGRRAAAAQAYRRALSVNPASWQAWDGLGFLAIDKGLGHTAWRDGQAALLVAGEQGPTLDLLGEALYVEGDPADALTYFTDAEEVQPGWWQSYYDAGRANLALGDAGDARHDLREALALNPASGTAWELLRHAQKQ